MVRTIQWGCVVVAASLLVYAIWFPAKISGQPDLSIINGLFTLGNWPIVLDWNEIVEYIPKDSSICFQNGTAVRVAQEFFEEVRVRYEAAHAVASTIVCGGNRDACLQSCAGFWSCMVQSSLGTDEIFLFVPYDMTDWSKVGDVIWATACNVSYLNPEARIWVVRQRFAALIDTAHRLGRTKYTSYDVERVRVTIKGAGRSKNGFYAIVVKLFLPLMPMFGRFDRLLLLDTDIVALQGVFPWIWEETSESAAVHAQADPGIDNNGRLLRKLGLKIRKGQKYFNAGVMVIELHHSALEGILEKALRPLMEDPKKVKRFLDQDCYNIACWNLQSGEQASVHIVPIGRWQSFEEGQEAPLYHAASAARKSCKTYLGRLERWLKELNALIVTAPWMNRSALVPVY